MIKLTYDDFIEKIFTNHSNKVAVVAFSANWCDSCQNFQSTTLPQLEKLYSDNNVVFYKVDVDENPELADQHNINKLPTFLFFKDRSMTNFIIGNESIEKFKKTINDTINL